MSQNKHKPPSQDSERNLGGVFKEDSVFKLVSSVMRTDQHTYICLTVWGDKSCVILVCSSKVPEGGGNEFIKHQNVDFADGMTHPCSCAPGFWVSPRHLMYAVLCRVHLFSLGWGL